MNYAQRLSEQVEEFVSLYARTARASMSGTLLHPVIDPTEKLATPSRRYLSPSVFLVVSYILGFTLITCLVSRDFGIALSAALNLVRLDNPALFHRFLIGLLFCACFVFTLTIWSTARWSHRVLFAVGLLSTWRSILSAGAIVCPVDNSKVQLISWAIVLVTTTWGSDRRRDLDTGQRHAPVTLAALYGWFRETCSLPDILSRRTQSREPTSKSWRQTVKDGVSQLRTRSSRRWEQAKQRIGTEPTSRVLSMLGCITVASMYAKYSAPRAYVLDVAYAIAVTVTAVSILRRMDVGELHRAAYFTGTVLLLTSFVVPFIFANLPSRQTESPTNPDHQMALFLMLVAVLWAVGSWFNRLSVGVGYLGLTLFSFVTISALAKPLASGFASQPAPIVNGYIVRSADGMKMLDCGDGKVKQLLFGAGTSGWQTLAAHLAAPSVRCPPDSQPSVPVAECPPLLGVVRLRAQPTESGLLLESLEGSIGPVLGGCSEFRSSDGGAPTDSK